MSTLDTPTPTPQTGDDHNTRLAWATLVAAPFVFALAVAIPVVAGNTVYTTDGGGDTGPPTWTMWFFVAAGLAMFILPAVLSRWFWNRAHRVGDDRAKVPAVIILITTIALPALFLMFLMAALANFSE
jgi:hypothetical protein